jgi:hypothetical protein
MALPIGFADKINDLDYDGTEKLTKMCRARDLHNSSRQCGWTRVPGCRYCRMVAAHNALNVASDEERAAAEAKRAADEAAKAAAIEAEKQAKLDKANRAALAERVLALVEGVAFQDPLGMCASMLRTAKEAPDDPV